MISFTIINKKKQAKKSSQVYKISFTIINKKEQAINLCQKYFNSYDTFYYNK